MIRFLSLSLLCHLLLLAPIYFLLRPATAPVAGPDLQFSKGEIFVGQSPESSPAPSPSAAPPESTSAAEVSAGLPETWAGAPSLGTPDGDAYPTQAITVSYPPLSSRLGEQGTVTIAFEISTEGLPGNIQVIGSSGFSRLDSAALQAISKASYSPAIRSGAPISSRKEITIEFRLNEPVRIAP